MEKPLYFLFRFSLVTIQTIMCAAAGSSTISRRQGGFSLPLIHGDSTNLHRPSTHDVITTSNMRSPLIPSEGGSLFSVNVSIGEPAIPQLLVLDTGSDLSWVQCSRCRGCQGAISPTYDPLKSSSYRSIPCISPRCSMRATCNGRYRKCMYSYLYHDGTNSSGTIGYERFTFRTSADGQLIQLPRAVFGCAQTVQYRHKHWQSSGIFGLAASINSMFTGAGYLQFSYCLGNISDPTYKYNKLIVGDGAILEGDSVPMQFHDFASYHIRLEGISVGETNVIDPTVPNWNVIIDTSARATYLKKDALDPLKAEVRKLMNGTLDEVELHKDYLCFSGDMRRDLHEFPAISLHFAGGFNLELDSEGAFFYPGNTMEHGMFCLAFLEAKGTKRNIIGVIAQQYHNVGFNLETMSVSFQRTDCQLLEG